MQRILFPAFAAGFAMFATTSTSVGQQVELTEGQLFFIGEATIEPLDLFFSNEVSFNVLEQPSGSGSTGTGTVDEFPVRTEVTYRFTRLSPESSGPQPLTELITFEASSFGVYPEQTPPGRNTSTSFFGELEFEYTGPPVPYTLDVTTIGESISAEVSGLDSAGILEPGTFLWSFGLSSGVDEVGEVISQDLSIALAITIPEPATGLAALALLPVLARRRRHAGRGCR